MTKLLPSQKPSPKVTLPQLPSLESPLYEIKPKPTVRPKPRKKPTRKVLDWYKPLADAEAFNLVR
jgi:hypothetical protein